MLGMYSIMEPQLAILRDGTLCLAVIGCHSSSSSAHPQQTKQPRTSGCFKVVSSLLCFTVSKARPLVLTPRYLPSTPRIWRIYGKRRSARMPGTDMPGSLPSASPDMLGNARARWRTKPVELTVVTIHSLRDVADTSGCPLLSLS